MTITVSITLLRIFCKPLSSSNIKTVNRRNLKKHIVLSTILKTADFFVIITATSTSVILSVSGLGKIVLTISIGTAGGLTLSKTFRRNKYEDK